MIARLVTAFGKPTVIACDRKCHKAWGISGRPRISLSDDPDDYAFLPDGELGDAPLCAGTWEGGHGKPNAQEDLLNKWCFRACERSVSGRVGELISLPDFSRRRYNLISREDEALRHEAGE